MSKIDKFIKNNLDKEKPSNKYNEMILDTMEMISNNEIERESGPKNGFKMFKILKTAVAVFVIGILGVTTYAGVTRKIYYWRYRFKEN